MGLLDRIRGWSVMPKPVDFLIILIALTLIVFTSISIYADRGQAVRVEITSAGGTETYPLSEERTVIAPGPLGASQIVIGEAGARFLDSPCPDKLCIRMGAVDSPGQWIACLPNRVFVKITGKEESPVDAYSF